MAHALEWPFPGYPADFGEPVQVYRHTVGATAAIAVRLLMLLAMLSGFAYAGYRLIVRSSQWSPDGQNCGLPAVLLALFCMALFLATPLWQRVASYRSQRGDAIVVCPQGVAQYHQRTWHHARWEDIAHFRVVKDTMGKDLVDDSLDGIKDTTRIDNLDFLSFASLALMGGLWQLLGGNNERYIVRTKTGEEIVFGNTFSDSQKLVRSCADAPASAAAVACQPLTNDQVLASGVQDHRHEMTAPSSTAPYAIHKICAFAATLIRAA